MDPDVPVTVMIYDPLVVPSAAWEPAATPFKFAEHPVVPAASAAANAKIPSQVHQVRRRGIQRSTKQAMAAPPAAYKCPAGSLTLAAATTPAAVEIVIVAVAPPVPVRFTTPVEPKLTAGRSCALAGMEVICAVSVTGPTKPASGVTVTVAVLPLVAPEAIETDAPLTVNEAPCGVVAAELGTATL